MSTSTVTPPVDPPIGDLTALAVRFLDAMLDSADAETIGYKVWWDRARVALETGADSGTTFAAVVATTARTLKISGALSESTSCVVVDLASHLADQAVFAAWRQHCQLDAVYITALVRMRRTAARAARNDNEETK